MNQFSDVRSRLVSLLDDGKGWILLLVSFGWLLSLGTRYVFPALFPYLQAELGLSLSTLGVMFTLLWAAFAIGQFPAGYVGDAIGVRRVLTYSVLLSAVAILGMLFIRTPELLALSMILYGGTSALYGPARFTILANIYSEYDGTAIGVTQAFGQIGNTILPAASGLLAAHFIWQAGFVYVVPLFVIAGLGIWIVIPKEDGSVGNGASESMPSLRTVVSGALFPLSLVLTGILAIAMFIIQGVSGLYPAYLVEIKGFTPATASTIYALMFASGILTEPLGGTLKDRIGSKRALLIVIGLLLIALPLVVHASTRLEVLVVTLLFGSVFATNPIALTHLTNAFPVEIRGSCLGLMRTSYLLIASLGSSVVGTLADQELFDEAFLLLALLAVMAFALTLTLGRLTE